MEIFKKWETIYLEILTNLEEKIKLRIYFQQMVNTLNIIPSHSIYLFHSSLDSSQGMNSAREEVCKSISWEEQIPLKPN